MNVIITLGIDPGNSGGIAVLSNESGRILHTEPMPTDSEGKYDHHLFADAIEGILKEYCYGKPSLAHAEVEKAQSMPKQGISSAFNYGTSFGSILGVLSALRIPFARVSPSQWHRKLLHGTSTAAPPKARAMAQVQALYPEEISKVKKRGGRPHDGIVDAVLIARYGWLETQGKK